MFTLTELEKENVCAHDAIVVKDAQLEVSENFDTDVNMEYLISTYSHQRNMKSAN